MFNQDTNLANASRNNLTNENSQMVKLIGQFVCNQKAEPVLVRPKHWCH